MRLAIASIMIIFVYGCSPPIRSTYQCIIPSIEVQTESTISEYWPTQSFLNSSCSVKTPRNIIVSTKNDDITVLIETSDVKPRIKMYPTSQSGENLSITGDEVFLTQPHESYARDFDLALDKYFKFDVRDATGSLVESFELNLEPVTCNCVGYDGP